MCFKYRLVCVPTNILSFLWCIWDLSVQIVNLRLVFIQYSGLTDFKLIIVFLEYIVFLKNCIWCHDDIWKHKFFIVRINIIYYVCRQMFYVLSNISVHVIVWKYKFLDHYQRICLMHNCTDSYYYASPTKENGNYNCLLETFQK